MYYDVGIHTSRASSMTISSDGLYFNPTKLDEFQGEHGRKVYLMQYTGLKDKNDKEIYEGDILKEETSGMYKEGKFTPHYSIGFIDWASPFDGYVRYKDLQKQHSWVNEIHSENTEIIGNIYLNPELLK